MNFRTTFILGGIFLGMLLLMVLAISVGPGVEDQGRLLFPELLKNAGVDVNPAESMVALRLERTRPVAQTIELKRDPQTRQWMLEQPVQGLADSFMVNNLVRALVQSRREEDKDAQVSLGKSGLKEPSATLTLTDKDGVEHTLSVGQTVPGATGNLLFVLSSGRKGAQVVQERDFEGLFRPLGAWRDRTLLAAEADVDQFKLSMGPTGAKPAVSLRKTLGNWRYEAPAFGLAEPAATTSLGAPAQGTPDIGTLLRAIGALRVEQAGEKPGDRDDFLAEGVRDPAALAEYGLDPARNRVLRLEVERAVVTRDTQAESSPQTTNSSATLLIGLDKPVQKPAGGGVGGAAIPAAPAFKGYQSTVEGTGSVVLVPAAPIDELLRLLEDPALVRDRAVLRLAGEPDWIEITNGLGTLELVREGTSWKLHKPGEAEGRDVEPTVVPALLESLRAARGQFIAADTPMRRAELELDRPRDKQVAIRFWVGGIVSPEKNSPPKDEKDAVPEKGPVVAAVTQPKRKDQPATAEVVLGRRQGEEVSLLRVNGPDQAVMLVPRGLLDLAEQGPLAYMDRKIPTPHGNAAIGQDLAIDQVTGVSLRRGAESISVARKDKNDPWKFTAPSDRAVLPVDPQAIRTLLVNIGSLQARKLLSEKPDQLASRGLEPPAMSVILTIPGPDGKAQAKTLYLGRETGDGGIFARADWHPPVFTVDLATRGVLEAPWENRSLFPALDPAKLTRIKLTGWQSVNGSPVSLVLERDKDQWLARDPASDFPVAQARVTTLLQALKALKFEKILAYSGGGEPGLSLDPAKNGLLIEWTTEGEKDPVRLTIGRAEGAGFAAASSLLPGMAVVVPKAPFEEAMQGRGKFRQ